MLHRRFTQGVGHFLLFPAKYFSTWWGIFHFWHATKTNPHLYPGVGGRGGGVGVYFNWCISTVSTRCIMYFRSSLNMVPSLFDTIFSFLNVGNVLLLLLLLLMLHYLMVLYDFRNMPPGPRLSTLPVLGSVFSLDLKAEKFGDAFRRSVKLYYYSRIVSPFR